MTENVHELPVDHDNIPHNLEAEQALLGALLNRVRAWFQWASGRAAA